MLSKDQEQNVTQGSTAIQALRDVIITQIGVTAAEARNIAQDLFDANFYKLQGIAAKIAKDRADEIVEKFLSKLQRENPAGLGQANDPDFQYSLFTAQKEYARSGNKDLGDLLVSLLVDRSKQERRSILQIALSESLSTAPKVTENQLVILAIIFLFRYPHSNDLDNHQGLAEYLDRHVAPFATKIVPTTWDYRHLEYTGCGVSGSGYGMHNLESILSRNYRGFFTKGFEAKEITRSGVPEGIHQQFFIPCLNDPSKMQVCSLNEKSLEEKLNANAISPIDGFKIKNLFSPNTSKMMDSTEIRNKCIELRPYMSNIFDTWSKSETCSFNLTSVGMAIAHANIKRFAGEFTDLSLWIN